MDGAGTFVVMGTAMADAFSSVPTIPGLGAARLIHRRRCQSLRCAHSLTRDEPHEEALPHPGLYQAVVPRLQEGRLFAGRDPSPVRGDSGRISAGDETGPSGTSRSSIAEVK